MLSIPEADTLTLPSSIAAAGLVVKTHDAFGRHIHYLRVSLTDRCNLRCVYCMPEHMVFRPSEDLLTDRELCTVLEAMSSLSFDKYRLTGGEPTVRPGVVEIVRRIASLPNTREVAMTTNGLKLARLAQPLKSAGLQRVNISIDSLDPVKFKRTVPCATMVIKLFATLKDRAGAGEITLQTPATLTVGELRAALAAAHPGLSELIARSIVSVNREFAFNEDVVRATDEVALFPPVSGGAA